MRILFVNYAPISSMKGTERFFVLLGNYLTKKGHEVFYLSASNCPVKGLGMTKKVDFQVFDTNFIKLGYEFVLHVPRPVIRQIDPDVIYLNTFALYPLLPLLDYKFIFGTMTFGVEDYANSRGKSSMRFRLYSLFLAVLAKFLYRKENIIIHVLNEEQPKWLKAIGFAGFRVSKLPLPIDCNTCKPKPFLWKDQRKFQVLYIGGIGESKGIIKFLEIVKILLRKNRTPEIHFCIVGTGKLVDAVVDFCSRNPSVEYLGAVSDSMKIDLLNESAILLSPSNNENFHVVSAEAQICGLPVISSDISGPREIIEDGLTGRLIDKSCIDDFVKAVIEYFEMWTKDFPSYMNLRKVISERAKRFCDSVIFPHLLEMFVDAST